MQRALLVRGLALAARQVASGAANSSGRLVAATAGAAAVAAEQQLLPAAASTLAACWRSNSHCFSTSSSAGDDSSSATSTSAASGSNASGEAVVDNLSSMMDVMLANPAMQQMMLARLPPHMRRPEVLRAMMANPEVRQRIAALAQQTGLDKMLSGLDAQRMAAGLSASSAAGIDPTALFERFSASPTMGPRMSNPRVLAALMDMASNGPDALKKHSGDKEVVEAAMEAGEIISTMQAEQQQGGQASSSSSSSSSSDAGGARVSPEAALGMPPQELMQRLMQRPDLLAKVQDPEVQAALTDVAASPWKVVKYLFNRKVMGALKDMKDMMQQAPPKQ